MTGGDEVPAAPRVGPGQVRAHPAVAAVADLALRVLAVHVVDPVAEVEQEPDRVQVLPDEVARVPVQPERLPVPDGLHRRDRRPVVVGDLAGVHLVREPHPDLVEHVQDRVPPVGEVAVAGVDHLLGHRREHRHGLPDARPGEPDDGVHTQLRRGPRGHLHRVGGTLPHALGLPVSPHPRGQDALVAGVDRVVADGLAGEVVGDREDPQAVLLQDVVAAPDVVVVLHGRPRVEVVAPAGDLQPVVAPLAGEPGHLLERQVGPLPGEQRDRSRHQPSS
jgi:hypothetical protein